MKPGKKFFFAGRRFVGITAAVVLLVIAAAPSVRRAWIGEKNTEDFAPTYRAAQAMWNHQDIREATGGLYIYSPFVAFIFQPITALPEHTAALVWIVLSAVLLFTASIVAAKQIVKRWRLPPATGTDNSLSWLIAAVALLLSYDKVHAEFRLMQVDALLILGFALILPRMDRKSSIAGLIVGIVANIKYLALIFVPYFVIKRNYRAAIASVASFVLFMMLPAVEVGFRLAGRYAADALGGLAKLANLTPRGPDEGLRILPLHWDRSVSFTSAIFRTIKAHGLSDWIAAALVVSALIIVLGTIILMGRHHGVRLFAPAGTDVDETHGARVSLEWAALIVVALVFSPQIMARHMLLLVLVYIVAAGIFSCQHQTRLRGVLMTATLITVTGLSLPFRAFDLDHLLQTWRAVAGASWCALLLILAVIWVGSATISEKAKRRSPGQGISDVDQTLA